MSKYNSIKTFGIEVGKVSFRSLVLLAFLLLASIAGATSYVTFNDGHLLVFPDECIQSVIQEDGHISFTARDGKVYTYLLDEIASIDEQLTKELPTITFYKINNEFKYQVFTDADGVIDGDTIRVEVAGIGKRLTASFKLSDSDAVAYVDGVLQQSKVSRMRFEDSRIYTVCHDGDMVLKHLNTGAYEFVPFGRDYVVEVDFLTDHTTSVPRIDVNTVGGVGISSKEYYVDAEIIIDGAGVFPSMTDSVQIKGRGNDSWTGYVNGKNPYRLKFANKVKPFGLKKGKNWVLLANNRKGSLLTNAIGMKAASLIGTVAVNHIIPVDLYVNGMYKGNYNFTEKVGFAGNSVDLDDETAAVLLELDTYYDEVEGQKFKSTPYSIPVNIKHPDFSEDVTVLSFEGIQQRFNDFVADVYDGKDFSAHVDAENLARFLMVNELIVNREIIHPKSTFCYNENLLNEGNRFIFGPLWDLDWSFGYNGVHAGSYFNFLKTSDFYNDFNYEQLDFIVALRNMPGMGRRLYQLWQDFMGDDLDELCEFCEDYYEYAKPSIERGKAVNLDDTNYQLQSYRATQWIRQRAEFLYQKLAQEVLLPGDIDGDGEVSIGDIALLIDYLLQSDAVTISQDNADVEGDGEVSVGDVAAIIDLLLLAQ